MPSSHWIIVAVSNLFSSCDLHYADCHKQALRVSTTWGIESGENHVWIFVSAFTCSTDEWNGKYLKPETLFISSSKTHSEPLWSTGIAAPRVINHSLFGPGFIVWNCPTPALDGRTPRHGGPLFLALVPWTYLEAPGLQPRRLLVTVVHDVEVTYAFQNTKGQM